MTPCHPDGTLRPPPRLTLALAAGALVAILLGGCRQEEPYRQTRFLMGTLVEVAAYPDSPRTAAAVDAAFRRMEAIEDQARPARGQTPNLQVEAGRPLRLTADIERLLAVAGSVSLASGGVFDPTVGLLAHLWGFDVGTPALPDPEKVLEALSSVGLPRLARGDGVLETSGGPVRLDFGAVAEGYAADEAVKVLRGAGVKAAVIDVGGDLAVMGERPGRKAWRIGIRDPSDAQALLGVVEVKGGAVATSGDYENFFMRDGVRYHHILDPRTGYPARSGLRSVTILAPDCAHADALATAVYLLGAEKGLSLLDRLGGVEAILVDDSGALHTTAGIGREVVFERLGKVR